MTKTFTNYVKEEILEHDRTDEETVLFLIALIKINGTLKKGEVHLRVLDKTHRTLLKKMITDTLKLKVKVIENNLVFDINSYDEDFNFDLSDMEINNEEELRLYLTGIFFGKGYINSPKSKYYHLEIRIKKLIDVINISELMFSIGIPNKFLQKSGWYYIYVKKSDLISDLLIMFGTPTYSMVFIDQKIQRDFNATISRQNAIDVYNQSKVADASIKQCDAAKIVLVNLIKFDLKVEEIRISKLRLEHPEISTNDLTIEYNILYHDNKSKSTINRWLNNMILESSKHD